MKTIAIEEHFVTPMYREKVIPNKFSDLDRKKIAHLNAERVPKM